MAGWRGWRGCEYPQRSVRRGPRRGIESGGGWDGGGWSAGTFADPPPLCVQPAPAEGCQAPLDNTHTHRPSLCQAPPPPPPEDGTSEPLPSNKSCSASPAATGTCPPEEDTVPLGKRPSSASTPSSSGAASPGGAEVAVSGASRPFILSLSRPSNAARTSPSLLPTRFSEVRVVLADNADDRADRAVEGGQGKGVDSPSTN